MTSAPCAVSVTLTTSELTQTGWQRAFVLHSRPWSETSLMLDVFTEEPVVCARLPAGARSKRSNLKGALQPFTPLLVAGGAAKSKPCAARKPPLALPLSGITPTAVSTLTSLSPACWSTKHVSPNSTTCTAFRRARRGQRFAGNPRCGVLSWRCSGTWLWRGFSPLRRSGEPVDDTMTYRYREEKGFIASP